MEYKAGPYVKTDLMSNSPYYSKLGNLEGEFSKEIDTNIVPLTTSSVISRW